MLAPAFERIHAALADRYELLRELGRGGMATVYLARDVRHARQVAIKVLHPELAAVLGAERFLAEIKTTANLQHLHILPLFDSGTADGQLFYVMPFVEGETLRARLDRETQLPIGDAVQLAREVADALQYAHERGVIHRDIKPENILLQGGHALVADFGIALAVQQAGGQRMTQTGLSLGTPQYMAPEQAMGDKAVDARADIYALGAVAYEMLAGEPPFTGPSAQAILARLMTQEPQPISAARRTVPPHVDVAITRALAKLPADRWVTARQFSDALTGATAASRPSGAPAPDVAGLTWSRAALSRWRELPSALFALLAVGGIGSAIYLAQRPQPVPVAGRFVIAFPDSVRYYTGGTPNLAITPDGLRIAMTVTRAGAASGLYVRQLSDAALQFVAGSTDAEQPSFSPDGESLLFHRRGALYRVPTSGGTPTRLADSVARRGASWGDDGTVLFVRGKDLWRVPADGGMPKRLAKADSAGGVGALSMPEILPGGTHALVNLASGSALEVSAMELGVVNLEDGSIVRLTVKGTNPHFVEPDRLVFARETGVLFSARFSLRRRRVTSEPIRVLDQVPVTRTGVADVAFSRNGHLVVHPGGQSRIAQALVSVDRAGKEQPIADVTEPMVEPRVSPDGRRVVVRISLGGATTGDLWLFEVGTGARSRLTSNGNGWRPEWIDGGRRIAWLSGHDLSAKLVARPWDLSEGETTLLPALASSARGALQGFSSGPRDGWSMLRTGSRAAGQNADIYIARSDSLASMRPLLVSAANEVEPRVSPDGRLLAYSTDEAGRSEVWVTRIPGPAARTVVSIGGAGEPVWSADGRRLFYRGANHLMAATIAPGPEPTIVRRDTLFRDVYRRYSGFAAYDVFPDGEHFAMTRSLENGPRASSKVEVIMNWPQLLGPAARKGAP